MATHSSQQNNNGLIRQYLAHQQTIPCQAIMLIPPEPIATSSSTLSDTYLSQAISDPIITPAPSSISGTTPLQTLSGSFVTPAPFNISNIDASQALSEMPEQTVTTIQSAKRLRILRAIAVVLVCMLGVGMYFIWPTSSSPTTTTVSTTQQQFSAAPTASTLKTGTTASPVATNGKIQVYIVGAVKNPGVYTLESNARIYNLLQVAGGPLPEANLVALNLAASLNDGQEIYVARIGETPPASLSNPLSSTPVVTTTNGTPGTTTTQQININTATAADLRTALHISSKNAQTIITYRLQHGPFTSVEELSQVVSQAIYKKIKNEVKIA
jgi:competence protein ComEA